LESGKTAEINNYNNEESY